MISLLLVALITFVYCFWFFTKHSQNSSLYFNEWLFVQCYFILASVVGSVMTKEKWLHHGIFTLKAGLLLVPTYTQHVASSNNTQSDGKKTCITGKTLEKSSEKKQQNWISTNIVHKPSFFLFRKKKKKKTRGCCLVHPKEVVTKIQH